MPHTLQAGERRPLNVSQQGNHRVFVGLSWDPKSDKSFTARLKEILTGKKSYHDLDLACFLYDQDKNYIDVISGKIGALVDQSGGIYHSGDDREGMGGGDDEQISVELANLPPSVHHIIFKASIETGHNFAEIEAPFIRLIDAYSQRAFFKKELDAPAAAAKNTNYIMAELYRSPQASPPWNLHIIDQYTSWGEHAQWKKNLIKYLS